MKEVVIPSSVKSIREGAFCKCNNLSTLTLSEGLESIGDHSFQSAALREVVIPGSVKRIEMYAFYNCKSLSKVTFQNGVEIIGESSFSGTALREVVIPSSVKRLECCAFSGYYYNKNEDKEVHNTTLQKVILNKGLESIGDSCFSYNDGLREVVIPSSVKSIGVGAFCGCSNLSVIF